MKLQEFQNILSTAGRILLKNQEELKNQPVLQSNDPVKIKEAINEPLPEATMDASLLLDEFRDHIMPFLNHNKEPRYGAYITGSGNLIGSVAEMIKGFYNQNGLKWNNSPITAELEQLVIKWTGEFVNLPEFNQGLLTSGGSMSNFLAIHLALAKKVPEREKEGLFSTQKLTIYCSDQTHSSIERSLVFLGIGRAQLRKISVNEKYEIIGEQLIKAIEKDISDGYKPLMLIGNAGTTNTGSIDNLQALADIAKSYNIWYHVDGAYGLPAINLPQLETNFKGIEQADSITINPHKWMYVPFEASCILTRKIPKAINFDPDYLMTENKGVRWESSEHTIELSKEFKALKVWFTLKNLGRKEIVRYIEQDIQLIDLLAQKLRQQPKVEVEPHHPLSILCFRWNDTSLTEEQNELINRKAVNLIESRGIIFITSTRLHGKTHLRVYYGNPERTEEDVQFMYEEILKTYKMAIEEIKD